MSTVWNPGAPAFRESQLAPAGKRRVRAAVATEWAWRRDIALALSFSLAVLGLMFAWRVALAANEGQNPPWVDWVTYSNAVHRMTQSLPVFSPAQLNGPYWLPQVSTSGYDYPPASVPLFAPFASQPIGLAFWEMLNIGLLLSGVWAILRRELGRDAVLFLGIAMIPVVTWLGFGQGIAVGNVSIGLSGVLAWAWALGRGRTPSGAIALVGIAKVFPAILICWTTPDRLVRSALTAGLIAAAWITVTLPFVGPAAWGDFARSMGNAQPTCSYGPSVACMLAPVTGTAAAKLAAIVLAGALGLGAVFVKADLVAFAMIALAWVAAAYDLSAYAVMPLLVMWVVVFAVGMRRLRARMGVVAATVAPRHESLSHVAARR